jgi:hypothetical protein
VRTKRPPGRGTGLGLFCGQAPQATRNATITSPGANAPATADTGAVIANVTVSNASSVPTITVANPCTLVSTYPLNQRYHITPGNYLISWVWPGYGQEQAYYFAALGVTGDLGVPVGVFLSVYPNGQLTPDQFHTVENDSPASS